MCGIFLIFSKKYSSNELLNYYETFEELLSRRGPDYIQTKLHKIDEFNLLFSASVLWLQGKHLTQQPLENDNSITVYNGDVFGGIIPDELKFDKGDTILFSNTFLNGENDLSKNHGPYAFIHLNKDDKIITFGRDIYGRRSLLINFDKNCLILTSTAKRNCGFNFIELPSIGIFSYYIKTDIITLTPWNKKNNNFQKKLNELEQFLNRKIILKNLLNDEPIGQFQEPNSNELQLYSKYIGNENNLYPALLNNPKYSLKIQKLKELLEKSVEKRIINQPGCCKNCIRILNKNCTHSLIGILFSGGIDCTILALLIDKFTPKNRPIDLINVAFDRAPNYESPDRLSAYDSLRELNYLSSERQWNFIEVNISKSELDYERQKRIADLIYPLKTVLDDDLGCALWFAARATNKNQSSSCRILFVGMGADELFGGYNKHRTALHNGGWNDLNNSLQDDWENLSYRNLGRDDRVISDHGRQLRTPYLDEDFVEYVRSLKIWEKTCPFSELSQGIGDKIMLRTLGYSLGLRKVVYLRKRALQFGTRIANRKENADSISTRLQ